MVDVVFWTRGQAHFDNSFSKQAAVAALGLSTTCIAGTPPAWGTYMAATAKSIAKSRRRYRRDVLRCAEGNHMWINAFACIRPSDELKRQIGAWVLEKLAQTESTILSDDGGSDVIASLGQRELVCRFNKS